MDIGLECHTCGETLDDDAVFCHSCGKSINKNNQGSSEKVNNGNVINENPFYIDKFKIFDANGGSFKLSWNWPAFLFSWIWYFYKGLYYKAVIMLAIIIFNPVHLLLFPLLWVYSGIFGNWDYYLLKRKNTQFWA